MNVILLNITDTHFGIRRHHKSDVKNGMRQGIGALAHFKLDFGDFFNSNGSSSLLSL
jgi:hypothetical protein